MDTIKIRKLRNDEVYSLIGVTKEIIKIETKINEIVEKINGPIQKSLENTQREVLSWPIHKQILSSVESDGTQSTTLDTIISDCERLLKKYPDDGVLQFTLIQAQFLKSKNEKN